MLSLLGLLEPNIFNGSVKRMLNVYHGGHGRNSLENSCTGQYNSPPVFNRFSLSHLPGNLISSVGIIERSVSHV